MFQFTFLWFTVIIMLVVEDIVVLKLYMNHTNKYILGGVCMGLAELALSLLFSLPLLMSNCWLMSTVGTHRKNHLVLLKCLQDMHCIR